MAGESTEAFCSAILDNGSRRDRHNLAFYLKYLFGDTDFADRHVLDVGGGTGVLSFYAAAMGASLVVCLDPAGAGSQGSTHDTFLSTAARLGMQEKVTLVPLPLDQYSGSHKFDVLILHSSINHLNETACMGLKEDDNCREAYLLQLSRLASLAKSNARLIVCDCSNRNLFAWLHIPNPIDPGIEWRKHQAPEIWARVLEEVGFRDPHIRWHSSFNSLRTPGRLVLGNRFAAYLLTSTFCLTMSRL